MRVRWYVDQRKAGGRTVSTQFDTEATAREYAAAVGGEIRKPVEAEGAMGSKLFDALKK